MKNVQDNIEGFLKLSVTIAVGTVVEGLEEVKYSWSSAHQAARYRLVLGAHSVIAYNELPSEKKPEYVYPLSTEKHILNSLKLGDLVKLESYMGEFVNEVRQFSSDEIMLAFAQLLVMTERTCKLIDNGTKQDTLLELTTFQKQLHIQDTLEQLGEWYLSFCSKIIELQTNVLSIKNTEATERMISYIHKNYGDPIMSVEVIAEHVGLSTNYARKVFKDYAHESLSVYISSYRFEKARKLLLTTDDPANKICELVGMSNTAYFYQAFKKHFGKTPDQMRREYNVNNDKD
jgi:YesN/AraC family two-component response regulator